MERALELPHDVDALQALVLVHRQTIASQRETIVQLEQHNRLLAKLVFGRSSEKRAQLPVDPALQGNLFLAEIAAEADRPADQPRALATAGDSAETQETGKLRV